MDDVLALLARLTDGAPLPTGASADDVRGFEARTGLTLPGEVVSWLQRVNGALVPPGNVFGLRDAEDFLSIEHYLRIFPDWAGLGWVPIAGDGNGDYWVVFRRDAAGGAGGERVWVGFVDAQEGFDAIDQIVAGSVLSFLRFLFEGELADDDRWPYDADYVLARDPELAQAPSDLLPWR
ncbi:MAG: hypothetical protein QOI20_730 [Acidimicrobiaceae bacterium]|jgi:cell wall assembly regulator SMI1|nr:hypothetical protein [Acidimicrobiaceae bacterium]